MYRRDTYNLKTILLGHDIKIHPYHRNLVHESLLISSDCVIQWQLIIYDYAPNMSIFWVLTTLSDVLSRLPTMDKVPDKKIIERPTEIVRAYTRRTQSMSVGYAHNYTDSTE